MYVGAHAGAYVGVYVCTCSCWCVLGCMLVCVWLHMRMVDMPLDVISSLFTIASPANCFVLSSFGCISEVLFGI